MIDAVTNRVTLRAERKALFYYQILRFPFCFFHLFLFVICRCLTNVLWLLTCPIEDASFQHSGNTETFRPFSLL